MGQPAKILLVEDDNNLSEIYQARMAAEGYILVSAHDGEEALALAAKEKPDLIISDVMMPKISGFEMLDILRNTEGLKNTKIIMLTALGQAEDKTRADALGADRYLVKSQVTLEDIVKSAQELLGNDEAPAVPAAAAQPAVTPQPAPALAPTPQQTPTPVVAPAPPAAAADPQPSAPAPQPAAPPHIPVATPPSPVEPPTTPPASAATPSGPAEPTPLAGRPAQAQAQDSNDKVLNDAVNSLLAGTPQPAPANTSAPAAAAPAATPTASDQSETAAKVPGDNTPVNHKKIIAPIEGAPTKPDLNSLLAAEEAKTSTPPPQPPAGNFNAQAAAAEPQPPVHQPGNVFSPAAQPGKDDTGLDPSKIAL